MPEASKPLYSANMDTTAIDSIGTARKSVYNPVALMWSALLGLPGLLIFMILYKLTAGN